MDTIRLKTGMVSLFLSHIRDITNLCLDVLDYLGREDKYTPQNDIEVEIEESFYHIMTKDRPDEIRSQLNEMFDTCTHKYDIDKIINPDIVLYSSSPNALREFREDVQNNLLRTSKKSDREAYIYTLITPLASLSQFVHHKKPNHISKGYRDIAYNCFAAYAKNKTSPIGKEYEFIFMTIWVFECIMGDFAQNLDAAILPFGFDLMRLQNDCDVFLQKERDFSSLSIIIGSEKLAQKYLKAINISESECDSKQIQLDDYFVCPNYELLDKILHREVKGCNGVAISIVLRALEGAGCTRKGGVKPLLENILKPIYGAEGTHQALSNALKNVNDEKIIEIITKKATIYRRELY